MSVEWYYSRRVSVSVSACMRGAHMCMYESAVVCRTRSALTTSEQLLLLLLLVIRWVLFCVGAYFDERVVVFVSFNCEYARSFSQLIHSRSLSWLSIRFSAVREFRDMRGEKQYRYPCYSFSPALSSIHPSFLPSLSLPLFPFFRSNRMIRSWLIVLMQIKSVCITKTAAA